MTRNRKVCGLSLELNYFFITFIIVWALPFRFLMVFQLYHFVHFFHSALHINKSICSRLYQVNRDQSSWKWYDCYNTDLILLTAPPVQATAVNFPHLVKVMSHPVNGVKKVIALHLFKQVRYLHVSMPHPMNREDKLISVNVTQ